MAALTETAGLLLNQRRGHSDDFPLRCRHTLGQHSHTSAEKKKLNYRRTTPVRPASCKRLEILHNISAISRSPLYVTYFQ